MSSNFQVAKIQKEHVKNEVISEKNVNSLSDFCEQNKLKKYCAKIKNEGFTSVKKLSELNDMQLNELCSKIGMPYSTAVRFQKLLKQNQGNVFWDDEMTKHWKVFSKILTFFVGDKWQRLLEEAPAIANAADKICKWATGKNIMDFLNEKANKIIALYNPSSVKDVGVVILDSLGSFVWGAKTKLTNFFLNTYNHTCDEDAKEEEEEDEEDECNDYRKFTKQFEKCGIHSDTQPSIYQLKKKYRENAKLVHPDRKNGDPEEFMKLQTAFQEAVRLLTIKQEQHRDKVLHDFVEHIQNKK